MRILREGESEGKKTIKGKGRKVKNKFILGTLGLAITECQN